MCVLSPGRRGGGARGGRPGRADGADGAGEVSPNPPGQAADRDEVAHDVRLLRAPLQYVPVNLSKTCINLL
eukprot:1178119-Prorocentrum_minimum.AAC.2